MTDTKLKDKYFGPRTRPETIRLRAQHDIVRSALGGKLIHCPIDLSRPNLRILDSATADGYFLFDLWCTELGDPDSAVLIGTDIAQFPELSDYPPNITLKRQNIMEDWPTEWEGTFDLAHQKNVIVHTGTFQEAVKVVRRLAGLVKPGGWIQIVDCYVPHEPIEDGDEPSDKLFKTCGQYLKRNGMDNELARRLEEILKNVGGLEDIGAKHGVSRLGKGEPEGMEETSKIQLEGFWDGLGQALKKEKVPAMPLEEYMKILPALLEQARERGVDMHWYSAWARRP
jgi:hypothetical protein